MSTIDDGGPAFPAAPLDLAPHEHGLSIRDYFAAAAMRSLLSREDVSMEEDHITKWAFKYADAMIAARKAK